MGEVYRARDTNLDRDVAIKVLPEAFTSDPDRLARFEREAKVLASLNHPNIGAIYGLEKSGDTRALVLELIEGPTLAERIKQGPIPVDEALPIATQIAEALEAAHEQGIIHRDLKPANIKVKDDGTVKVLDFGLAKAFQPDASDVSASLSPTISLTAAATQMGMVIGTAAYMAPEQAKGRPVDKRADVWAFGVVLYEMFTGARPFAGDDVSETLARVIDREPDWAALPSDVPPVLSNFLRHCLQKNPKQRIRDIGDVSLALIGGFETTVHTSLNQKARQTLQFWQRPASAITTALLLVSLTAFGVWNAARPQPQMARQIVRVPIDMEASFSLRTSIFPFIEISPDGSLLTYAGNNQIFMRPLNTMEATVVAGTQGFGAGVGVARVPFFSPDGQWLGFAKEGQLRKVSVNGGPSIALSELEQQAPAGATWADDDTILFAQPTGIWRVSGDGGTAELVVPAEDEVVHGPQLLPGSEWILFTVVSNSLSWSEAQIVVQSLRTQERQVLLNGGRDARYVPTGHIVYLHESTLLAAAFDPDTLTITSAPIPMVEGVTDGGDSSGEAHFSVSNTGTLIYVPGRGRPDMQNEGSEKVLVWVDRDGNEDPIPVPPRPYDWVRLSPSGELAAAEIRGENNDVWVSDLSRGTLSRLTTNPAFDAVPLWTTDGLRILFQSDRFQSDRSSSGSLFWKSSDGVGEADHLWTLDGVQGYQPGAWAPDGGLITTAISFGAELDIGILSMESEPVWEPLIATAAIEANPSLSPDGQWIAYQSDQSGQRQIYAERFPEGGSRQPISVDGGQDPVWSPDGEEIFYLTTDTSFEPSTMMAVRINTEPILTAGAPMPLFEHVYWRPAVGGRRYDVAPDGRFLMIKPPTSEESSGASQITVVLNWFQELTDRVPVP